MAKSMGIAITAEGVETIFQRNFLRNLDCEDAQGFLFSTPVTAAELTIMLEAGPNKLSNA